MQIGTLGYSAVLCPAAGGKARRGARVRCVRALREEGADRQADRRTDADAHSRERAEPTSLVDGEERILVRHMVHAHRVDDVRAPLGEQERALRLFVVARRGGEGADHRRARVASKGRREQPRELRVAVWDMDLVGSSLASVGAVPAQMWPSRGKKDAHLCAASRALLLRKLLKLRDDLPK
jgi:hypothetical protein